MLVPMPSRTELLRKAYPTIPRSPIPKTPIRLRRIIESYAWSLFHTEGTYYLGDDPRIRHWLASLANRIVEEIMCTVKDVEESGGERDLSLAHHGLTYEQILEAATSKLEELIKERLISSASGSSENIRHPETLPRDAVPEPQKSASPESKNRDAGERERRIKLLAEYKKATGNTPDYRIYNAKNAGIHKPEFYDWKSGKLSRHSVTSQKFERFLREQKPPIPRKSKD